MKNLIFVLPLTLALITACGGTNTPANATQPTTVSGTITGYTGGAASIDLRANSTIATGNVNTSGAFTLILPAASAVTPYLSTISENDLFPTTGGSCTGTLTNSNSAAKIFGFESLFIGSTQYTTVQIVRDEAKRTVMVSGNLWLYADQTTTFSGTKTCMDTDGGGNTSTLKLTYTMPLKVGWNLVKEDANVVTAANGQALTGQLNYTTVNDQATVWSQASTAQPLSLKNAAPTVNTLIRSLHLH